jgi:hypothetical protein
LKKMIKNLIRAHFIMLLYLPMILLNT